MPTPVRGLTQPERVETSARRLLQAAAQLIVEKGWEATTAAEISRRAGYSRAMVHARYGSRESILDAFMHEYVRRLDPDPNPAADGLTQVLAHFDRIQDLYDDDPDVLRAMFVTTFEAAKTTSPLRDRVQEHIRSATANVASALRAGADDGSVRGDIDVDRAAEEMTAALFGTGFTWVVLPEHDLECDLAALRTRVIRDYASLKPA